MTDELTLDANRCALIIQDHAKRRDHRWRCLRRVRCSRIMLKEQNVVENAKTTRRRLAAPRASLIIHVWYLVDEGAPGLKLNAPLFEGRGRRCPCPWLMGSGAC